MSSVQIQGPLGIRIWINESVLFLSISIYFCVAKPIPKIKIILYGSATLNRSEIQKKIPIYKHFDKKTSSSNNKQEIL